MFSGWKPCRRLCCVLVMPGVSSWKSWGQLCVSNRNEIIWDSFENIRYGVIHDEIRVHDATVCFYVVSKIRGCGASIKSNPVGPLLTLVDFGIYSSHDQRSLAERKPADGIFILPISYFVTCTRSASACVWNGHLSVFLLSDEILELIVCIKSEVAIHWIKAFK